MFGRGKKLPNPPQFPSFEALETITSLRGQNEVDVMELAFKLFLISRRSNNGELYDGDLYQQCGTVGRYMHDEGISNLVLLDRSARPAHVGIRQYSRMRYPDNPAPKAFFIDPEAILQDPEQRAISERRRNSAMMLEKFRRMSVTRPGRRSSGAVRAFQPGSFSDNIAINTLRDSRDSLEIDKVAVDKFRHDQPKLSEQIDKPVLIFDTCTHSGESMLLAKTLLIGAGFEDVRTGVVGTSDSIDELNDFDFVVHGRDDQYASCYPFGYETAVCKSPTDMLVDRTSDVNGLAEGIKNRNEIRATIIRFAMLDPDMPNAGAKVN
jgi:hypothetical protein